MRGLVLPTGAFAILLNACGPEANCEQVLTSTGSLKASFEVSGTLAALNTQDRVSSFVDSCFGKERCSNSFGLHLIDPKTGDGLSLEFRAATAIDNGSVLDANSIKIVATLLPGDHSLHRDLKSVARSGSFDYAWTNQAFDVNFDVDVSFEDGTRITTQNAAFHGVPYWMRSCID